jgi:UDP-2-acetamido-2,6-beta-L-arabino-hexul-4-ose reductase
MTSDRPRIVVTGANGFIGANLVARLQDEGHDVQPVTREMSLDEARDHLSSADVIFHLAGANGPEDPEVFDRSNRDYTQWVARAVADGDRKPLVVYSSSAKAVEDLPYGRSKLAGEKALLELASADGAVVSIWRLPNVCGKWSRPNYNSVIATFCHNIARNLPIQIDDPAAPLTLLHIDDLIDQWLALVAERPKQSGYVEAALTHATNVGEVAALISAFASSRLRGEVDEVGGGLKRILYSSYVSALPVAEASYALKPHTDARGSFVEILKTASSGQFSSFSAHPGVTRGGHYHHSKVEKFFVAHGTGRFRFRHVRSGESFELISSASEPLMIETIPGWGHDVTNIGDDELVVLIWTNEQFDPERPDTHPMAL